MKLRDVKKRDYITLKEIDEPIASQVWIRGDYNRSIKKYEIVNFNDMNYTRYIKGDKEVFINFTF